MAPSYRNAFEWHHAQGVARHACARVFRDGGSAADAMRVFGLPSSSPDWCRAVDAIAASLCARW